MIRAFYAASSGMTAQSIRQDVIANNIANAQTAGFKRERVVAQSFADTLQQQTIPLKDASRLPYPDFPVGTVIASADAQLDTSQGPIRQTSQPLDFAIQGPGWFEVASPQGARLTRGGEFQMNSDGELCTIDGAKLQGESGTIRVPKGKIELGADGTISVDGKQVDKLKITGQKAGETTLLQGAIEEANVNIVREMTDMITNMRAYEANQRVLGNVDRTLEKLISEAGRV